MKALLHLAWRSAWNRRFVVSLVALSIALSTFLILSIERLRADVHEGFAHSVSGTDLIVGPRAGPLQLLLYSVFRIGSASNTLRASSAEKIAQHPAVAWTIPLALGDTHRGFPVLATTQAYFDHFRHGERRHLALAEGAPFAASGQAVLGADVAQALGYRLGQAIVLTHGSESLSDEEHADRPFTVSGILHRTGTPVDRTVHITLEGMEAMHEGWIGGMPPAPGDGPAHAISHGSHASHASHAHAEPTPGTLTALLVGLKRRGSVFSVQRDIAQFKDEPLMAILPGVVLDELWTVVGGVERAMQVMAVFVAAASLAGLVAVILAGLEQRRRELAILRSVGAGPRFMVGVLCAEGLLITLAGLVLGTLAHFLALALLSDWLRASFGVPLRMAVPGREQLLVWGAIFASALAASLIPAARVYRLSLADGLSPRT